MNRTKDIIIIIPARYASTRFPGKPLAKIGGKEMIAHVCDRASQTGCQVAVATDDERIKGCVESYGYTAVMTSPDHKSGTDRVKEAFDTLGRPAKAVINVQGDEPFIAVSQIEQLASLLSDPETRIATLARKFDRERGFEALFDPNLVKVTFSRDMNALYFSRSIIPYVRRHEWKEWLDNAEFHTHVGIYGYRADVLDIITTLPESALEQAESLEQLRWLENGFPIKVGITEAPTIGIDTPADLEQAELYYRSHCGK